ncbi:MAG: Orotidine 5'-phosphate decarboxylase [uncultured bacterium (gcode 4)]|uniref:Orotidine 5'-phosphate decarboxylase n=1 Tax=uncultured bacterium (gcode 4) TaxID=1234023 RepID=K2GZ78_9BACT|nr:MAG: Orotidine 5'-phosphate decarboxylase [uncultured bacterium (gcode 4)]
MLKKNKIIIALDSLDRVNVKSIIKEILSDWNLEDIVIFKVNDLLWEIWLEWMKRLEMELINEWISQEKLHWMLDPKWNDIPNTIENYFKKLKESDLKNVDYVTIMASGWSEMIRKAVMKRNELKLETKILAVTVFTSFDINWAKNVYNEEINHQILKLSQLALVAWAHWLVCSSEETRMLKEVFSQKDFELVTPWIRLEEAVIWDDQKRINTPEAAIIAWATHIVIWRPILNSENKIKTIKHISERIKWISYIEAEIKKYSFEKILYTWNWEELLKYIWAIYKKPENWYFVRLASKLLSDWYVNIWATERNFRVMEKAWNELALRLNEMDIKWDVIMGAQMWSIRLSLVLAKYLNLEESIYTEKDWDDMVLKRHEINLEGKKVILSEDVITKWSTLEKMIKIVNDLWWEVVAITCVANRSQKNDFNWIPLISCYSPEPFGLYFDEKTPSENIWKALPIPEWAMIIEKPKNEWEKLVKSMII